MLLAAIWLPRARSRSLDPDAGENAFQTSVQGQQGNLGALVLASDGSYTYTVANAATQSLGLGDTHIDTFTITSVDGTTKQISFTINGANDGAVIGDPTVSAVTEDVGVVGGNLVAAGTISISDPDAGENAFQTSVQGQQGNLGALVLASDGSYTYTVANAATQSLGLGDTHIDTFTITSVDGTTKQISFTINGANDGTGAVIGDPRVCGDGGCRCVVGGNLVAAARSQLIRTPAEIRLAEQRAGQQGNLGALVLASDGSYTYTVANAATLGYGPDVAHRYLHDHQRRERDARADQLHRQSRQRRLQRSVIRPCLR